MYPATKYNLNGGSTTQDVRLNYANMPNWQVGTKQVLLGSEYDIVEPISKIEAVPSQVEFELPANKSILFGPMTKFIIKGGFQYKRDDATGWLPAPIEEGNKVFMAPFWFEMLLKEISVFHNNYKVASSSETRFIAPYLNAYLHAYMEPTAKKILCPQLEHPAYCLPINNEEWKPTCNGFDAYKKRVFKNGKITFEYTPLFLFPFYQGSNFMMEQDGVPRILHMPSLGSMQIRFNFHDDQDRIFFKEANNPHKYRFAFTGFDMMVEKARLNQSVEKPLQNPKRNLIYPGVTRMLLVEQVPDSQTTHHAKFQDIVLPESLFIFCLDKSVASGTYTFATETLTTIFRNHNIQSVDLSFDGIRFAIKEPNLGTFRADPMDSKSLFDHMFNPPFGIRQDVSILTHAAMVEGSKATAFPHLYIPLTKGADRQRLVPALDSSGASTARRADLAIDFKFTNANSAKSCVYIIYACYTDVNMIFDHKTRLFYSPYLKYMN